VISISEEILAAVVWNFHHQMDADGARIESVFTRLSILPRLLNTKTPNIVMPGSLLSYYMQLNWTVFLERLCIILMYNVQYVIHKV
jgi:hypothetical protein